MNTKPIVTPLTFLAYSLGCRTNQAEIEDISLQLMANGLRQIGNGLPTTVYRLRSKKDNEQPDMVLLNTCVVTAKAEKETRQKIRELRKKFPKSSLVVLGCGVTVKERLNIGLPEADLLIPNNNKNKVVEIIIKKLKFLHDREEKSTNITLNKYQLSGRKFIKIQEGCDCGCSFCLTQFIRGKPTSVPPEKIIEEINFWIERGIKEIILTGINIGLYGTSHDNCHSDQAKRVEESLSPPLERDPSTEFIPSAVEGLGMTYLINKILDETKVERISFSSIYPEMLTDDFIKSVVNNPRVSQYFHLSLQSGSPSVLERMNRKTDLSRLKQKISRIKKQNSYFTFRADIITGFPNETEKEFQETLDFIKKAKISFVHSFLFSFRPGTSLEGLLKSGKYHEVPSVIKKQRAEVLEKEVEKIRNNEARKQLHRITNCLIVRQSACHSDQIFLSFRANEESRGIPFSRRTIERDPSTLVGMTKDQNGMTVYEGITENGWPIKIKILSEKDIEASGKILDAKGKILPVKIIGFEKDYLIGEITSLPTN